MDPIRYDKGELWIEGVTAREIADSFGTPTYVYAAAAITDTYKRFIAAFEGGETMVCYAVKANSNLGVLGLLAQLGAGFDVVSVGELERVLRAGGDPKRVVFSGVGKQRAEIARALEVGIKCFNIESASELRLVAEEAARQGTKAPISVRVNPDVDAQTHPYISTGLKENKFGVSFDAALELYREAETLEQIRVAGVDIHIGSQITSLAPYAAAITRIGDFVDELGKIGIEIEHIDLGGGIGVSYEGEAVIDIEEYASTVRQILSGRKQTLVFEPGRMMVADAGVLLCRVITIKENEAGRLRRRGRRHERFPATRSLRRLAAIEPVVEGGSRQPHVYDVVGPVCETGDFLGKERELAVAEGDIVAHS
ncbi:MAG: diaminopimelate decarboxylase [Gammaproteobacteria bacterium]|nr:diaminopimelate decarboxylase [Gammaproteobacteria bacterium]